MYFRVRLLNPDRILAWLEPIFRPVLGRIGFLAWTIWVIAAFVTLIPHWNTLVEGVDSVRDPNNWGWMIAVFVATKLWHELGHGLICKRLGGQVPEFGAMMLVLVPSPYVDATAAWSFPSKWQRMAVGAGGMIFELAAAAAAAFIWVSTPKESTLHQLAYNVIFMSSVTTVMFNANPLMRFDGYYILSDWLEVPNLAARATQMLKFLFERHVYRVRSAVPPTGNPSEALILLAYGLASMVYRVFLFVSITLYIMGKMFAIGLFLAAWTAGMWFILPVGGFIHWLATSPRLAEHRTRAILASLVMAALVIIGVGLIPAPDRRRATGVVESVAQTTVYAAADGFVKTSHVRTGDRVVAGQPLVTMESRRLDAELRYAQAQLDEARAKRDEALGKSLGAAQAADEYCRTLEAHLRVNQQRREGLIVRAPHDGVVVSNDPSTLVGAFLQEGRAICDVVDDKHLRVTAVLTQPEASWITTEPYGVEARLVGTIHDVVTLRKDRVIEAGTRDLPHESLGFSGGGRIEIDPKDRSGRRAKADIFKGYFFPVLADGTAGPGLVGNAGGLPGERVVLRFQLPSKPLAAQWWDRLQKTLQGRAKV